MGIPQILLLVLFSISLLLNANQHGKEREGKHNFWITLISVLIELYLLIEGGFFNQ